MDIKALQSRFLELCNAYHELDKIQLNAYREAGKQYGKDIKEKYRTESYAKDNYTNTISQADESFRAQAKELNSSLRRSINEFKKELTDKAAPSRPADHAARILAACKFIDAEGADLTDKTASGILREFIEGHDFEDLEHFHRIIERQVEETMYDVYGRTTWPLTFKKLYEYRTMMSAVADLEESAKDLFTYNRMLADLDKAQGKESRERDGILLPADGYMQPFGEATIPEKITTVGAMTAEFFPE